MATYQTPLERLLDGVEDIPLRNEINSIINMLEIEKLELIAELDELEREREGLLNLVSYHKEKQKDAEDKNEPYRHQNKRYREAMVYVTETIRNSTVITKTCWKTLSLWLTKHWRVNQNETIIRF